MRTLEQYRIKAGLSQKDLARKAGLGANSVPSYETCRRLPSKENVAQLAKYLDVDAGELYTAQVLYCMSRDIELFQAKADGKYVSVLKGLLEEAKDGKNAAKLRMACVDAAQLILKSFFA